MTLAPSREDLVEILEAAELSLRKLEGARLLITGAAGFLGSYLCHAAVLANDELLSRRCEVWCLDTFVTGVPERLAALKERSDCHFLNISATTPIELAADQIIHAASIASPPVYRRLPLETVETNVLGTWNLLRLAARGCSSFLYLSSSEVYGDPDPTAIPTGEGYVGRVSFTGPRACYDESKRIAETLCRLFFERYGVPVKVARPFNIYGPGLRLDDGRVVPDLIRQALRGEPLVLHSDGSPTRSFCYVTDAVAAFFMLLASDANGEAFNVGTQHEVSMRDLAERVAALVGGREILFRTAEDPRYLTDNPRRRVPEISKLQEKLSWSPRVPLEEGLARTLRAYGEVSA